MFAQFKKETKDSSCIIFFSPTKYEYEQLFLLGIFCDFLNFQRNLMLFITF